MNQSQQGKKNREAGTRFELKVRKDLEKNNWIVTKWSNNVEFHNKEDVNEFSFTYGTLIPAKHKFRGKGIPMVMGTGFPDFIVFKKLAVGYNITGVECKSNGYLSKEEKEKCDWLLQRHIFSRILIASKGEKKGEITYTNYFVNEKNNLKKKI